MFSFLKIKISRPGDTIRIAGVLGAPARVLWSLDGCREGHGEYWSGLRVVLETSLANPVEILCIGVDLGLLGSGGRRAGVGCRTSDCGRSRPNPSESGSPPDPPQNVSIYIYIYIYISKGFALCRQPLWIDCRLSSWMFGWLGALHGQLPTRPLSSLIAGSGNGSESAFEVDLGVDGRSI